LVHSVRYSAFILPIEKPMLGVTLDFSGSCYGIGSREYEALGCSMPLNCAAFPASEANWQ
jgi:hypothetical protein